MFIKVKTFPFSPFLKRTSNAFDMLLVLSLLIPSPDFLWPKNENQSIKAVLVRKGQKAVIIKFNFLLLH